MKLLARLTAWLLTGDPRPTIPDVAGGAAIWDALTAAGRGRLTAAEFRDKLRSAPPHQHFEKLIEIKAAPPPAAAPGTAGGAKVAVGLAGLFVVAGVGLAGAYFAGVFKPTPAEVVEKKQAEKVTPPHDGDRVDVTELPKKFADALKSGDLPAAAVAVGQSAATQADPLKADRPKVAELAEKQYLAAVALARDPATRVDAAVAAGELAKALETLVTTHPAADKAVSERELQCCDFARALAASLASSP